MYSHLPSVATPISPMVFSCPSWVFKENAAASENYDIPTQALTAPCSASELRSQMWERRDSNPLRFLCAGFTVPCPSAIWAALPIVHPKPLSMKRKRWLIASYAIVNISALSTYDFRFCRVSRTRTCDLHIQEKMLNIFSFLIW